PPVIIEKAFSTHVCVPPFLYLLPLLDETTTGFTLLGVIIVGPWAKRVFGVAAATPAAAVVCTNSRRFSFFGIWPSLFTCARGPTPARLSRARCRLPAIIATLLRVTRSLAALARAEACASRGQCFF